MLPSIRTSLAAGTSALMILGGTFLLPGVAVAVAPSASDTVTVTAEPTDQPSATPAPVIAPTPAETSTPVDPGPAAPTMPPSTQAAVPTPTAAPNPSVTRITVSTPSSVGTEFAIVGARPTTKMLGYAAVGSAITITDTSGTVLGTGNANGDTGLWTASLTYPDEAYNIQTVIITAVRFGVVEDVLEHSFRLAPLDMEPPTVTTPAAGTTVSGPGQSVPVSFSGTGVAGARLQLFQLPFAGIRLDQLDGDQIPTTIGETTVAADGSWTLTAVVAVGEYSFSAVQGLYAENPDPQNPFRSSSSPIEYRDLFVTSSDAAAAELPETGTPSPALGTVAFLLMCAGAAGMFAARRLRTTSA